jgi:hypothetical protein
MNNKCFEAITLIRDAINMSFPVNGDPEDYSSWLIRLNEWLDNIINSKQNNEQSTTLHNKV